MNQIFLKMNKYNQKTKGVFAKREKIKKLNSKITQ